LEDGRLTDGRGQTVSFSDSVIIFTSNIGAAHVDPNLADSDAQSAFLERVKDHFVNQMGRPELLNRIGDNIVAFNFVRSLEFLAQIIKGKLQYLEEQLKEKYGIKSLRFVDEVQCMEAISSRVEQGMGGRGALTALTSNLLDPLSLFLFEQVPDNSVSFGKSLLVKLAESGSSELFEFSLNAQ
jgi:ATP-dependent Clp protease ATP-binding subunit ClpA